MKTADAVRTKARTGAAAQSHHKDISLALVNMWPCKNLWHAVLPLSHSVAWVAPHSIAGSMGRGLEERQLLRCLGCSLRG